MPLNMEVPEISLSYSDGLWYLSHDYGYVRNVTRAETIPEALRLMSEYLSVSGKEPCNTKSVEPIPVRLPCPKCGELHIDEAPWDTKPHHTHACQHCGHVWRPAIENTVGVQFLPGFKNENSVHFEFIWPPEYFGKVRVKDKNPCNEIDLEKIKRDWDFGWVG